MSSRKKPFDRYAYYEASVMDAVEFARLASMFYVDLRGKKPFHMREDFCGTFLNAVEWVKQSKKHTAIALDLDEKPLKYGKKHHLSLLRPGEKKRVKILKKNVMSITRPGADVVLAGNFSFYIFKKREELKKYFRYVYRSMKKDGVFVMETAGGPGFIERTKDRRVIKEPGIKKFTYFWHQKSFDPLTNFGNYAIHFGLSKKNIVQDAFTYDWRVWSIPELREALMDAGFDETYVYWECTKRGKDEGEYVRSEKGSNDFSWIAYVVGGKTK